MRGSCWSWGRLTSPSEYHGEGVPYADTRFGSGEAASGPVCRVRLRRPHLPGHLVPLSGIDAWPCCLFPDAGSGYFHGWHVPGRLAGKQAWGPLAAADPGLRHCGDRGRPGWTGFPPRIPRLHRPVPRDGLPCAGLGSRSPRMAVGKRRTPDRAPIHPAGHDLPADERWIPAHRAQGRRGDPGRPVLQQQHWRGFRRAVRDIRAVAMGWHARGNRLCGSGQPGGRTIGVACFPAR